MKRLIVFALACASAAGLPMGNTTDWWAFGGDSLRDGWEKNEQRFTKDEVKDFRLLWQQKLDNQKAGVGALMPPVVLGRLIGYRGFKELAFVAGSSGNLWSIDSDLDKVYWQKHFGDEAKSKPKKTCTDELTAAPALPGPVVFHAPVPGKPARAHKFGGAQPMFLLTADGMLRQLHQSDGADFAPPKPFIPAGVSAQPLNFFEDVIYTSTRSSCGQNAAVWSVDSVDPNAKPRSVQLGADIAGSGGVVLDSQGRAFVETEDGPLDPANGKYGGSVVALDKNLAIDQYFILPDAPEKKSKSNGMNLASPTAFTYKGDELVAAAGRDGRLYLLKAADLGTSDHHHYLSESAVLPAMDGEKGHGIWGGLTSWEDAGGSRYLLAPVWGPISGELQSAVPSAKAPNGSIVAFQLDDSKDGIPALKPVWVSRDMDSPVPPVIAQGVVFALANGKFSHPDKGATPNRKSHATLYAFDGATGDPLFSTGDKMTAAGNLTGLTIANGRIYFVTVDNTLQVFGKYLEP